MSIVNLYSTISYSISFALTALIRYLVNSAVFCTLLNYCYCTTACRGCPQAEFQAIGHPTEKAMRSMCLQNVNLLGKLCKASSISYPSTNVSITLNYLPRFTDNFSLSNKLITSFITIYSATFITDDTAITHFRITSFK